MHSTVSVYLYGVIENQGIELCQVLNMVALYYMIVLFHETMQLLHVEEQLRHLTGEMEKKQINTKHWHISPAAKALRHSLG